MCESTQQLEIKSSEIPVVTRSLLHCLHVSREHLLELIGRDRLADDANSKLLESLNHLGHVLPHDTTHTRDLVLIVDQNS